MELNGKTALVTGGAVRVGRALALALAAEGVNIALHYGSSEAAAIQTADEIRAAGVDVLLVQEDLRRSDRMESLVGRAAVLTGGLDILVNSAAVFISPDFLGTSESDWDTLYAINLKAPFFLAQAFARALPPGGRAHIISVADWRGLKADSRYAAYAAGKAALIHLTQSLALALAPQVQVNAIAPGAILPPPGEGEAYMEKLAARIPLKRTGNPEEVARALLFLLRSDFITGETITLSGGEHLL